MMVIAVGLSSYNLALFHLVNHAFYKALLFLGAGAVIHAVNDNQDFRKYGGLISYLPLSYSIMLIASLSLVAFPFMTGFYSKDLIIESAFGQYKLSSIIIYFIATIGAMFTTLYSIKVLYITFLSQPNGPLVYYKYETSKAAHEGDIFMSLPLIILAIFSIYFGFMTKDIFIGLGSDFFSDNALFIHPCQEIMLNTEFFVPVIFKLIPLFFTISLTGLSILFTEFYPKLLIKFKYSNTGYNIFGFLNQRFAVELIYNKYVSGIVLTLGGQTSKDMDKGIVETFGPYGLQKRFTEISRSISSLSTGLVTNYALYILIGLLFFLNILFFSEFININFIFMIIMITLKCLALVSEGKPINKSMVLFAAAPGIFGLQILDLADESVRIYQTFLPTLMNLPDYHEKVRQLIFARNNLLYYYKEYLQTMVDNLSSGDSNIILAGHEMKENLTFSNLRECKIGSTANTKMLDLTNYPDLQHLYDNSGIENKNFHHSLKTIQGLENKMRF